MLDESFDTLAAPLETTDPEVAALRRPPQSLESERAVLGGLMMDNNAFDLVADILQPDDFYHLAHRIIYEKIQEMCSAGRPADMLTVATELEASGRDVGGMSYLNSLLSATPSAANIRRYAEIVRDRSILRRLITTGEEIATSALSPEGSDVAAILDEAQRKVMEIDDMTNKGRSGFQALNVLTTEVTKELQQLQAMASVDDVTGLPTGYRELDRMTAGLQKGDLIIVAGRPSMGKTTLAVNIAENAGLRLKMPVAIFSMEMSSVQLAKRIISSVGSIDAQKMRRARLDESDWSRFSNAARQAASSPLYIDDTSPLTINELRSRARRLTRKTGPLALIVVDYIQLMPGSGGKQSENRSTELSEISRGLKSLAKELKCPVIALSQLNRGVDARPNKRPMMSDLRESGAIEQDADVIMFIYRDWVYNKETGDPHLAEVIIGKQRNGPTGIVNLRFAGEYTRFEPMANDAELPPEMRE